MGGPLTPHGLASFVSDVVALTNAERGSAGLRPLAGDPRLTTAAQAHSDDMVARGFYSHTGLDGRQPRDRAVAAGCTHRGIGENIACGQRSPAEVVRGWMDSPGHRANILKPDFTHRRRLPWRRREGDVLDAAVRHGGVAHRPYTRGTAEAGLHRLRYTSRRLPTVMTHTISWPSSTV